MPTINQLIRQGRKSAANRTKAPALDSCPQKRGWNVFILVFFSRFKYKERNCARKSRNT